jgi:hypothetical protein
VSAVRSVSILSAAFGTFWSLFMCVGDIIGDQDEFAFLRIGCVIVWNVVVSSSFYFPRCVAVSVLIILMVLFALL